jgi:cell pole-organizing protein PopZ
MGQGMEIRKPSLEQHTQLNAVHSASDALSQSVLVENVRTLQDLVQEMLRPMLKSWLDGNLPPLVERLVRGEIERVTGSKPQEPEKRDLLFR